MVDPVPTSALRKHPEIAQQIGYLMEHFAGLEYFMFLLYVTISTLLQDEVDSDDINGCFTEFYQLRSVNLKSGLVLTAAKPLLDESRYRAYAGDLRAQQIAVLTWRIASL
jgi:hypothetical protein